MHGVWGKGGEANGYVLGAAGFWGAVSNPFSRVRDYGLAGADFSMPVCVFDAHHTF